MNQSVIIYGIIRRETGDAYVGSTVSLSERWSEHRRQLRRGEHHCRYLQRAWNKYGASAFDFSVLEAVTCRSREERYLAELSWIGHIGTYNHLVPSERSGQFVVRPDDRLRRRNSALAKKAADPAYRAFLEERGRAIAALQRSPEARARMALHTARRWQEPEERAKLARGLENRWANPEARAHMAEKTGARMRTPECAKAHSEKLKAAWQDPEKRARLQARLDARWADPEARARHSERMKRQWAAKRAAKAAAS